MTPQFDPARSAGIRQLLIDTAADARHRRPRATLIAGVLLAGMAVGAGASTAAFAASGGFTAPAIAQPSGQPSPELPPAVEAPPGTQPGAPVVSMIGGPSVIALSAPAERSLADRPAGATHVRVTISALTAGSVSWGTDADGNNPSAAFTADDLHAANGAVSWFDFPLDESTPTFFLQPSVGFTASVSFQYLNQTPTHLKRNANGETYGVAGGPDGDPDLVAVTATAADGSLAEGYARASDLAAFSPEHPHQPSTPEEATSWQEERDAAYPRGWSVPVFESDGETQIGTFHIG